MAKPSTPFSWRSLGHIAVWAHRGASNDVTENTLAAFDRAIADGADGVEFDVRLAGCGEVVVFHDPSLQRLASRQGTIARIPYRDLARVTLLGGHKIPTLDQALEACRALVINVELKPGPQVAKLAAAVATVVQRHPRLRVLGSSFSVPALATLAERAPGLPRALLIERAVSPQVIATARRLGAVAIHPNAATLSQAGLQAIHRAGLAANVYTVDHAAALHQLAAWRPDGVFTNCPASARAVLADRARPPAAAKGRPASKARQNLPSR